MANEKPNEKPDEQTRCPDCGAPVSPVWMDDSPHAALAVEQNPLFGVVHANSLVAARIKNEPGPWKLHGGHLPKFTALYEIHVCKLRAV